MKTKIRVIAQYYNENGKPKGAQVFTVNADSDDIMYCENLEEVLSTILEEEAKSWGGSTRFEYISHEVLFIEERKLDDDVFDKAMRTVGTY